MMKPEYVEQFDTMAQSGKFFIHEGRVYSADTMWSMRQDRMVELAEELGKPLSYIADICGIYHEPPHDSYTALRDLGGR